MKLRRLSATAAASVLTAGVVIACGNVYADPVETPYGFGPGIDSAPLTLPPNPPTPCPSTVYENGRCDNIGQACEFGESSDPDCNSTYSCVNDTYGAYWTESKPPHCAGKCPDPKTIIDGAPCTLQNHADSGIPDDALELQCVANDLLCACTSGPDGAHLHERKWVCVSAGEGCPVGRPNTGRSCLGNRTCDYGGCAFKRGSGMICADDVWQVEAIACP